MRALCAIVTRALGAVLTVLRARQTARTLQLSCQVGLTALSICPLARFLQYTITRASAGRSPRALG